MKECQLNYARIFTAVILIIAIPLILWQSYTIGYKNGVANEMTRQMLEEIKHIKQVQNDIYNLATENKEKSSQIDESLIISVGNKVNVANGDIIDTSAFSCEVKHAYKALIFDESGGLDMINYVDDVKLRIYANTHSSQDTITVNQEAIYVGRDPKAAMAYNQSGLFRKAVDAQIACVRCPICEMELTVSKSVNGKIIVKSKVADVQSLIDEKKLNNRLSKMENVENK